MRETVSQQAAWDGLVRSVLVHPEKFKWTSVEDLDFRVQEEGDENLTRLVGDLLTEIHLPFYLYDDEDKTHGLLIYRPTAYVIGVRIAKYLERFSATPYAHFSPSATALIDQFATLVREFEEKHLADSFFCEEVFFSVQGEGLDLGLMTTFIRTLGCDMKCTGCDTFYGEATPKTVGNSPYEKRTTQSLLDEIESNGGTTVCLTGGEPTLYYEKQVGIAAILRGRGYWITMQTNGKRLDDILCGLIQSVNLDIKPPSSFQPVRTDKIKHLWPGQQVKVLVGTPEDLEFALQVDAQLVAENPDVNLVLQPYIYGHEHNAKGVIQGYKALYDVFEANVKRFSSNVRMTIQSHKLIAAR